ncbi:MAG: hypothetical protein JWP46_1367 [Modestobacter sp.]|nr:hypothetical protein [Modestobacter sp.]
MVPARGAGTTPDRSPHLEVDGGHLGVRVQQRPHDLLAARRWPHDVSRSASSEVNRAAYVLWLLMAPDRYHRMMRARGWDHTRWAEWYADTMVRLLLP